MIWQVRDKLLVGRYYIQTRRYALCINKHYIQGHRDRQGRQGLVLAKILGFNTLIRNNWSKKFAVEYWTLPGSNSPWRPWYWTEAWKIWGHSLTKFKNNCKKSLLSCWGVTKKYELMMTNVNFPPQVYTYDKIDTYSGIKWGLITFKKNLTYFVYFLIKYF